MGKVLFLSDVATSDKHDKTFSINFSIFSEMSVDLLQHFVEPKTLEHPGGHFIPASGAQKKVYLEFLTDMITRKKYKQKG